MNLTESRDQTGLDKSVHRNAPSLRHPAQSRMIDGFAHDILRLYMLERLDEAQRMAVLVPMLAVALADKSLAFSRERYVAWCREWVTDEESQAAAEEWCSTGAQNEGTQNGVPMNAQLSLRLHRHLRAVERNSSFALAVAQVISADTSVGRMCLALSKAMRTWYMQVGRRNPVVEQNLARLLVHR